MRKLILLYFFFLNGIYIANAQTYPTIHNNRPRIYADSTRISWLKNNIIVPGDCQTTYNDFSGRYNSNWINDPQLYMLGSDSTLWTWDWSSQWASWESFFTVVLFKLTDDTLALKRCRFLAHQVMNRVDTASFATMDWYVKETLIRQMSDAGDMLLDWCYNDFPDSLQHQLTRSMYAMNREFMNTYILSGAGNSYVSSHNAWNNVYANQNALTLYNSSALDSLQNDTVNQWYQAVYDKWINGFLPCYGYYRDDDGGWNWGAAYAMWSLVDQFQMFENMRVGTNKNFYTDLPWVQNSINQYWYFMQPNNKNIHLGDGETSLAADRVMYLHAKIFNDPRSLWLAQEYSQSSALTWTVPVFNKLFYKDFNMPVVSHPNPPLNWWSDKVGLSVSRTSWNNDAEMVSFFNSPSKKAAHEHRDNNSFTIFKNAPLLIDAGYYDTYGGTHYRNYYQRTIAHNSICVFDSTDQYMCFGQAASNDGGQIESSALQNYNDIFLPQNQRGKWIQYASANNYEYNIADAQLSYDSTKLDFFRRRLLYLKPGKVIVLDHVHLKNTSTHQRDIKWIVHFVHQPNITGSIVNTTVPGHIEKYNGNQYTSTNGGGSIAVKTLLPNNTTATLIGGAGYEYWVNDTNYLPLTSPDTNYYTTGSWRIEVKPSNISDSVIFLHTINIGDSVNLATAGGIPLQNIFSVGTDWNDTLYYFSADADTGKDYHIFTNIAGNRTVGIFASDLIPGAYHVKVDGIVTATTATDNNGILQSSANMSSGNHTIEITASNSSVLETDRSKHIYVRPNPANSEISVILPPGTRNTLVEIYNISGEIKIQKTSPYNINISNLAVGIYYLKAISGTRVYSTKFVKE